LQANEEDENARLEVSKRGTKTGERGRPRKQYQIIIEQTQDDEVAQINDEGELALLSEISINEAMTGNNMEEWLNAMMRYHLLSRMILGNL